MTQNDSPPDPAAASAPPRPSLFQLYAVFFNIGAFSFGGGLTGWIFREVVTVRAWLSEEEFLSGLALGQILPGANVTNLAVYIGQRLRGVTGATVCVLGLLTAPFFAVLAFYAVYDQIVEHPWVHAALDGAAAAAIGLLGAVSAKAAQRAVAHSWSLAAMVATFVAVGVLRYPLVASVAVIAPLSVAAAWLQQRRAGYA
jgi:chromate transporter